MPRSARGLTNPWVAVYFRSSPHLSLTFLPPPRNRPPPRAAIASSIYEKQGLVRIDRKDSGSTVRRQPLWERLGITSVTCRHGRRAAAAGDGLDDLDLFAVLFDQVADEDAVLVAGAGALFGGWVCRVR